MKKRYSFRHPTFRSWPVLLVLLACLPARLWAQESAIKRRIEAQDLYGKDNQRAMKLLFENAALKPLGAKSGGPTLNYTIHAKKAERIEALRLLTQYASETGIKFQGWTAEDYMKELLNLSPGYRLRAYTLYQAQKDKKLWTEKCWLGGDNGKDNADFAQLYRNFRMRSILLGFRYGMAIPSMRFPDSTQRRMQRPNFDPEKLTYTSSMGLYAGGFVQWHFNSWLVGGLDMGYEQFSMERNHPGIIPRFRTKKGCRIPLQDVVWNLNETSQRFGGAFTLRAEIEVPTRAYAGSTFGRLSVAPIVGVGVNYLSGSIVSDFTVFSEIEDSLITHPQNREWWELVYSDSTLYSALPGRDRWDVDLVTGLALKMKFDRIHLLLEWRWQRGLAYTVKQGNLSFDQFYLFGYREYQNMLSRHSFTAGVSWNFYRSFYDKNYERRSFREKCLKTENGGQK